MTARSLSRAEIDGIVERTCDLVDGTTIADAIACLLAVHKLAEQHPDCSPIMRRMLTAEGVFFCRVIQALDFQAWQDGVALLEEDSVLDA